MKRVDLYSLLVNNGFQAPHTQNVMFFRGYAFYFFKHVLNVQERHVWEKIGLYSDEEWRKLLTRLQANGHIIKDVEGK